jgi:plastocyanin
MLESRRWRIRIEKPMNPVLRRIKTVPILLFVGLALWLGVSAKAAIYYVYVDEYGFDPGYQELQVGDTIWWINVDGWGDPHTSTSSQGYWDSGTVPYYYYYSLTFPYAGTYPYYDQYTGFTGTVVVKAPPPPPALILTSPARLPNGSFQCTVANLVTGKTFIIQASTNLVSWSGLYTNTAPAASYTYVDNGAAAFPRRFYRALALP